MYQGWKLSIGPFHSRYGSSSPVCFCLTLVKIEHRMWNYVTIWSDYFSNRKKWSSLLIYINLVLSGSRFLLCYFPKFIDHVVFLSVFFYAMASSRFFCYLFICVLTYLSWWTRVAMRGILFLSSLHSHIPTYLRGLFFTNPLIYTAFFPYFSLFFFPCQSTFFYRLFPVFII